MEILIKLNTRTAPDEMAVGQLFAWALRVEQGTSATETGNNGKTQPAYVTSDLPETGDADSEGETDDTVEGDVAEAEAQIANGGVATPKKRRGRRSNAEIAAEMAAKAEADRVAAAQSTAAAVPPVNLGQVLPPGYVAQTGPAAAAAAIPPAAVSPTVAETATVAAAFPLAQPAAMPAIPPAAPADASGAPSLEDLRAVALEADKTVRAGTAFNVLKLYGCYQVEKVPVEKRLEVIQKLIEAMSGKAA